jgi:hypothetical protein
MSADRCMGAQVLSLYRAVIRAAARQPDADTRTNVLAFARHDLEANRHLSLSQLQLIEHKLRLGHKQLARLQVCRLLAPGMASCVQPS